MTAKSFALALSQAQGSLYELQTRIEVARDLGFAPKREADGFIAEAAEISSMVNGLLSTLRQGN